MSELSNWEFETIVIYVLRALMDKVDSMQEQMGNVSREMEILRKNQREMLEIKIRITLMGVLVDWTQLRKELLSWRIYQ